MPLRSAADALPKMARMRASSSRSVWPAISLRTSVSEASAVGESAAGPAAFEAGVTGAAVRAATLATQPFGAATGSAALGAAALASGFEVEVTAVVCLVLMRV